MINNNNICRCSNCNGSFIIEEYEKHTCRKLTIEIFDLSGKHWGSYDGMNFFPLPSFPKIPDDFLQRDKNDRNPTETGQNPSSHKTKISLVISLAI